jgi:uncharacterized protein YkwD
MFKKKLIASLLAVTLCFSSFSWVTAYAQDEEELSEVAVVDVVDGKEVETAEQAETYTDEGTNISISDEKLGDADDLTGDVEPETPNDFDDTEINEDNPANLLVEDSEGDGKTANDAIIELEEAEEEIGISRALDNGFGFTDDYIVGTKPIIDYGETDYYGNPSVPIKMDLTELYSYAFEVLDLINEERIAYGLDPVIMDTTLLESAMQRAAETAFGWSHVRQNGTGFATVNQMIRITGENIACFYRTPADAVEGWMNSEGHRANILYADDVAIGVGVIKIGDSFFWVTDHARVMYEEADRNDYADIETSRTIYVRDHELSDGSGNSIDYRIDISITADTLVVGDTANIQVKYVNPLRTDRYDLPASGLIMTSSDESVATVSEDGVVAGISPGTATITAYYPNHEANATTFEVTVKTQEQADAELNEYTSNGNIVVRFDVQELYSEAFKRLDVLNAYRSSVGLEPLDMDSALLKIAMSRASDQMIQSGTTLPNGGTCSEIYPNVLASYETLRTAKSLSGGTELESLLKNSSSFLAKIESSEFSSVGIGVVANTTTGGQVYYGIVYCFGGDTSDTVSQSSYADIATTVSKAVKAEVAESGLSFIVADTINQGDTALVTSNWTADIAAKPIFSVDVSDLSWESGDKAVAVIKDGSVYGVASGETTITLWPTGYEDLAQSFVITVTEETEHNFEQNIVLSPSCTTEGYTTHVCSGCGYVVTDTEVPALGHAWGEGEITKAATRDAEGVMTYTCARCGTTMTEAIPVVTTLLGDVDLNDHVDMTDVTLLFQYVSGQGGEIYEAAADVTGDGIIDLKDVTRLMQYVDGQIDTL